jgi:DNA-binding PadR family transcriptional regulator
MNRILSGEIMKFISRQEENILLAVWKLQNNAYGIQIRNYLHEKTGEKISIGGIYIPLDRLVRKGYLSFYQGKPTAERGGMSKRFYKLTKAGVKALKEVKRVSETLWDNLPVLS